MWVSCCCYLIAVVTSVASMVVKISENVPLLASNCQNSKTKIEDFFSSASVQILAATNTVLDDVVVELPASWGDCGRVTEKKMPKRAVNVLIDGGVQTKAIQHQGCSLTGHLIFLNASDLLTSSIRNSPGLEFSVEWIKYKFGLFDELGIQGDKMYPTFYKDGNNVVPTACVNFPIRGNFTQQCLLETGNCPFDLEQAQIESSLLFSKANLFFPKISKLCNQTTHNTLAPTKQNLICGGKSAMEIIESQNSYFPSRRRHDLQLPSFAYHQSKLPHHLQSGLIIILDNGPQMESHWPTVRVGIEQLMLVLPKDTLLSTVIGSQVTGPRVVDNGNNDRFWETVIFPPNLLIESPLSIKAALAKVQDYLLNNVMSPHILIISATDSEREDLTSEVNFVVDNRIQVDILTFAGLNNAHTMSLTKFGGAFAVPNITDNVIRSAYVGSVLRQVGSQSHARNSQDVIMLQNQLTYARGVSGNFSLPNIGGLSPDDKFNMSLTFVGPWTSVPTITAFSPSGIKYGSKYGDNVISQKWSQQVMELKGPYEAGMWNYSIATTRMNDIGKTAFIVGHLNVKNEVVVQGFLDELASVGSVKGNETKAVKAYGFVNYHQLEGHDVRCHVWFPDSEEHDVVLLDNGLIAPDIAKGDGIFSQYIVPLITNGYHSSLCELRSADGSILRHFPMPSFHVIDHDSPFNDTIPPSRITDLQVAIGAPELYAAAQLNFTWTAPGDDYNWGKASYYKVYCGFSRDSLSYHDCNSITQTVMYARAPGSLELLRESSYREFDRELFVSVRASDGVNEGEFSNIVSIFVESPTTTSSTTSSTVTTPTSTTTYYTIATSSVASTDHRSTTPDTHMTTRNKNYNASIPADPPNDDEEEKDGLVISKTALIAIISSLSVMLFLIILLLAISICLKMHRKKEESRLLSERVKRSYEPTQVLPHIQLPQGGEFRKYHGMTPDDQDENAYRVTQLVKALPDEDRGRNSRSRKPDKKKRGGSRSRRSSRKSFSELSSDSGTEIDFRYQTRSTGHPNQAFVHSRTPSSSLRYSELNARKLEHEGNIGIPLDHLYARPQPRHSSRSNKQGVVVAGQGSFGRKPFQRHLRQSSHLSTSSAGTFQPVDPQKPWNGRSTTVVNVDTHERQEWTTDTEDHEMGSVRIKKSVPAPFFQNRVASNPDLHLVRPNVPFNYITFSEQLYGEKTDDHHASTSQIERPNKRAVSYV